MRDTRRSPPSRLTAMRSWPGSTTVVDPGANSRRRLRRATAPSASSLSMRNAESWRRATRRSTSLRSRSSPGIAHLQDPELGDVLANERAYRRAVIALHLGDTVLQRLLRCRRAVD